MDRGITIAKITPQPPGPAGSESLRELKLTCLDNLLASSEERIYFKDLMSRFLFVSEGWIEAITPGRAAGELTGKTDFDVFTEEHAAAAFADEQEIIRTGEPIVGQVERKTFAGEAGHLGVHDEGAAPAATMARSSARSGSRGTSHRPDQGRERAGLAGRGPGHPERAAARAGPAEGRVRGPRLTRAADPADLDHRLHPAPAG